MKFTRLLLVLVAFSSGLAKTHAQSQYQFTQYTMNPVFINPAQTGAFEGTYRAGGIIRSQWNALSSNLYRPLTGYIDAPVLMVAKRHWVGVGLMYANDQAGTHKLGTRMTALSGSFHYSFDKKFKNVLTLGLQFGAGSRGLQLSADPSSYSELKSGNLDPFYRATLNDRNASYTDMNVGLLFKTAISKTSNFSIGFSLNHVGRSKYSLLKSKPATVRIPLYMAGTIAYNRQITDKVSIHPVLLYHRQNSVYTINPQCMVGYKMKLKDSDSPIVIKGGLGYDYNGNAANVLAGVDVKNFTIGVGYDVNTGLLSNAARDAIEIAVQYTGKIYKKPTVKPVLVCPKY